jgi:hypothetical protein
MKVHHLASAEIVAVGTEILLGSLVDTNTAWLSQRLAASGIAVYRHTAVGDNRGQLVAALSEAAALGLQAGPLPRGLRAYRQPLGHGDGCSP